MNDLFDLSLQEIAILDFTNNGYAERPQYVPFKTKEPIILTTKASYIWPATLAVIIKRKPDIDEKTIVSSIKQAIRKNKKEIENYYREYTPQIGNHPSTERNGYASIYNDFIKSLNLPVDKVVEESKKVAKKTYESLVEKGLIEDPITTLTFGVSLAVIGFIPYGLTIKTRKGRTVYRKIETLLLKYEMKEEKEGDKETEVRLRFWKIIEAIKKALTEDNGA